MNEYEKLVKKVLERFPESGKFETNSKIKVDRLYVGKDPEYPGIFPFTRGIYPTMYRGRKWTIRQYSGFGDAKETNKRFRYLINQGQTGLSLAFDLPTQLGYDSNNSLCKGEVGKVGVAVDTLADFEEIFEGIDLDEISLSMTINSTAIVLLAMYVALAEKKGNLVQNLRGTIQNDVLKEYFARGTYIFPPEESMRLITDIFEYCSKQMPKFKSISVSGYHAREAGCSAIQELAFTFGDAKEYVDAALKKGLDINDFADNMSFFFSVDNDFFEEIAKFRAARRIWAKIMKSYGAKSQLMKFHAQTAGSTLTAQEPKNNIIRVTLQALAAVLGGTQSLHTNSMDEALALPSEDSVRIAIRTQQIIAEESNVTNTIDPLGGSHFVEALTDKIEEETFKLLDEIEKRGGMIKCIESGHVQKEIQKKAYEHQKEVDSGKRIIVGVNKYKTGKKPEIKLLEVDPKIEKAQVKKLIQTKKKRKDVSSCLKELRNTAQSDKNLVPVVIECVKNYATLQEICDVFREVFTEYKTVEIL